MTALIFIPSKLTKKNVVIHGVLKCLKRGGEFIVVVIPKKCYPKESKEN